MDSVHVELLQAKNDIDVLLAENASLRSKLKASQDLTDMLQEQLLMTDVCESEAAKRKPREASRQQHTPLTPAQFKGGDVVIGNGSRLTRAVVLTCGASASALVLQTPSMMCPFGIFESPGKARMGLRLAFRLEDRAGKAFHKQLMLLEERVKRHFVELESGSALQFVPCIGSKDGTLRVGVSLGDCRAFDEKQQVTDVRKCLAVGTVVAAIIRCNGVWFIEQRFGLSWSVLQVKRLSAIVGGLQKYAFQDDAD